MGKREKIEGTRRTSGRRWDPVVIFRQRRAVFTFERSDADASIVTVGGLSGDEITRERERERERKKRERWSIVYPLLLRRSCRLDFSAGKMYVDVETRR